MRIVFMFILSVILFSFKQENEDYILWKKTRLLTWDDFKGRPEKRFAVASTHYVLYRYVSEDNGKIYAHVLSCFLPKESWKRKNYSDEYILRHEQKHFDIVELYARKLRKVLTTISVKNEEDAEEKLDALYKIYDKKMDVFQNLYDDETNNSMDSEKQKQWEENIDAGIDSLNAYQANTIKLKLYN